MAWTISFEPDAEKDLARLDKSIQRKIMKYLLGRVATGADPEAFGKALSGPLSGLRRYRVEDHRIVCKVERERIEVLVFAVGHRKDVYEDVF